MSIKTRTNYLHIVISILLAMLAILFGNLCAPLIDHFVIAANVKRRMARNVQ